jgi:hypothetical protein
VTDLLIHIAVTAAVVMLFIYRRPRFSAWRGVTSSYSVREVLAGEHGFDSLFYILGVAAAYGLLIYLAIHLCKLFSPRDVIFWSALSGVLLSFPVVSLWPKKRPPNQWHDYL